MDLENPQGKDLHLGLGLSSAAADKAALRFQIDRSGEINAEVVTPEGIDLGQVIEQDLGNLGLAQLSFSEGIALAISDEVAVAEIEALALSCSEETRWEAPGKLKIKDAVYLIGPYRVNAELGEIMRLPRRYDRVFLLDMPRCRAGELAEELKGADPLTDLFITAQPDPKEWEILRYLQAIARRLGGIIWCGVEGESKTFTPDPDSAVALTLYSPVMVQEENLENLLQVLDYKLENLAEFSTDRKPSKKAAQKLLKQLFTAEELRQIELEAKAYDEFLLTQVNTASSNYQILLETAQEQHISVQVYAIEKQYLPPVLRWHEFPEDTVAVFRLSWLEETPRLNRVGRLRRLGVSEAIEKIAVTLKEITGGVILDADQFLL